MNKKPAIIIAANKSGSGKTTITLGILAALVKRGLSVQCFKCGPDFIDPTLHSSVTSNVSYNLDLRMMGADCCKQTFVTKSKGADVVVIEGVMGLFDGGEASTAALAKVLDIPVFLIIDAASSAESSAAMLKGFQNFDPDLTIAGVIFNRIGSPRHRQLIDESVAKHCSIGYVGYFGRDQRYHIPERHLGLHMGSEEPLTDSGLAHLRETVEQDLDLDKVLKTATIEIVGLLGAQNSQKYEKIPSRDKQYRLGVAIDIAFGFYYPQNFELFAERGFEIVEFSPMYDSKLPESVDMLYFGGGYPENYAMELSRNRELRRQILEAHYQDLPIYGECGGFMYLCKSLTDMDGNVHEMVGIFDCDTFMNKRLRKLGYRQVRLRRDCLLGKQGDLLYGHEFHYSDVKKNQNKLKTLEKKDDLYLLDNNSHEGYSVGAAVGSYIHLHFGNTVSVIDNLCKQLERRRTSATSENGSN